MSLSGGWCDWNWLLLVVYISFSASVFWMKNGYFYKRIIFLGCPIAPIYPLNFMWVLSYVNWTFCWFLLKWNSPKRSRLDMKICSWWSKFRALSRDEFYKKAAIFHSNLPILPWFLSGRSTFCERNTKKEQKVYSWNCFVHNWKHLKIDLQKFKP